MIQKVMLRPSKRRSAGNTMVQLGEMDGKTLPINYLSDGKELHHLLSPDRLPNWLWRNTEGYTKRNTISCRSPVGLFRKYMPTPNGDVPVDKAIDKTHLPKAPSPLGPKHLSHTQLQTPVPQANKPTNQQTNKPTNQQTHTQFCPSSSREVVSPVVKTLIFANIRMAAFFTHPPIRKGTLNHGRCPPSNKKVCRNWAWTISMVAFFLLSRLTKLIKRGTLPRRNTHPYASFSLGPKWICWLAVLQKPRASKKALKHANNPKHAKPSQIHANSKHFTYRTMAKTHKISNTHKPPKIPKKQTPKTPPTPKLHKLLTN